jgi:hypothetical protein
MKHYTLFDYLHDFRIWANYLEIEHLLNLRGPGYKAFLDQSLATILFFVGGIAELVFLACTSETIFRNRCQRFFEVVAASSTDIADKYSLMPPAQRIEVYTQLDLMRRGIEYAPKPDPNRVQVRPNGFVNIRRVEPDGAANGSQPIRSETNRTSSAAGFRR